MKQADVTVVIPALNRERTLGACLRSVEQQTVTPKSVVVVDDGSTDGTRELARQTGATVLHHDSSLGAGMARNTGVGSATTTWVAFLDSDDVWLPDHLQGLLETSANQVLITASALDTNGRLRGNSTRKPRSLRPADCLVPENPVVTSAVLARTQKLKEVGGFRALDRAEDLDLWVRLLERGAGTATGAASVVYRTAEVRSTRDKQVIEREQFLAFLEDYRDRVWMTPSVVRSVNARWSWDAFRLAMATGDTPEALENLWHMFRRPRSWRSIGRLAIQRRKSRAVMWRSEWAEAEASLGRVEHPPECQAEGSVHLQP